MTGTPLTKNMMSVRMSGGVPLVNVNSSVTWKALALDVGRVEQPDVPLALLGRDEDRLQPLEVLPGVEVALDVRPDPDQPLDDLLGSQVIHDAGVEPLELIDENGIEDRAGHPARQVHGLLGREVGPAGFDRVADEGFLNRDSFRRRGRRGQRRARHPTARLRLGLSIELQPQPTMPPAVPSSASV